MTGIRMRHRRPQLRRSDDGQRIEGYAAVFYDPKDAGTEYSLFGFRERIERGAFKESIKQDDIVALFNHDANQPLGRTSAGTLRLAEDARGLKFSVDIGTDLGRSVAQLVDHGDTGGASFAFEPLATREERGDDPVLWIEKARLFDVSVVTYPAYEATAAEVRSGKALLHPARQARTRTLALARASLL